jgi:hypothetical protein
VSTPLQTEPITGTGSLEVLLDHLEYLLLHIDGYHVSPGALKSSAGGK